MRLLTFIIVGAAIGYGINYMIKKDESGHSILDDIADRAPDLFDQARKFTEETVENLSGFVKAKTGI